MVNETTKHSERRELVASATGYVKLVNLNELAKALGMNPEEYDSVEVTVIPPEQLEDED